ncbi:MAG TPA: HAD family hydrolase [Candidatus Limnocylindria bacterium]|nr:HAD family hydrolase [Candidatus Limnocylindria bacterium]
MPVRALIVDLDNTLVPEFASYERAFDDGCGDIAQELGLDVSALRRSVFEASHALWRSSPWAAECLRLGIGSPTSLLTDLTAGRPEHARLRAWMPEYRREAWHRGLAAHGVEPASRDALGRTLDAAFRARQRVFSPPYPDAVPALRPVAGEYGLAMATNGPGDVQRAKVRASGLERYFPIVVISEEIGSGKPEAAMLRIALERLGVSADEAVVVGDSRERDIAGARNAGVASILVDRGAERSEGSPSADATIASLAGLSPALAAISSARRRPPPRG